jgi:uncharacterized protein with PQ loop repeat|tara:strand:+ start:626 stop:898 length:273 start_codon:yes stop_codon:yes gene_type:complete
MLVITTITAVLGSIGLALLLASGFPQIIKLAKTKTARGISIWMYLMTFTGIFLLFTHAVAIKDKIFMATNMLNLFTLTATITLVYRYRKN